MKSAAWKYYPPEDVDLSPLWALVSDTGEVIAETDTRPSLACCRELGREYGVTIERPE